MELFVLRHGHAEPEAPEDKLRNLSAIGEKEVNDAVQKKMAELQNIQCGFVSPYLRAQQSSEVVKKNLNIASYITSDLLIPSASPINLIEYLFQQFQTLSLSSAIVISHQPLVGTFVDLFCNLEPGKYRMSTASLVAIDFDVLAAGCGNLRWVSHVG